MFIINLINPKAISFVSNYFANIMKICRKLITSNFVRRFILCIWICQSFCFGKVVKLLNVLPLRFDLLTCWNVIIIQTKPRQRHNRILLRSSFALFEARWRCVNIVEFYVIRSRFIRCSLIADRRTDWQMH